MLNFIEYFENLYPEYDNRFYESVIFRFATKGGDKGRELETFRNARHFSNIYEIYIYAALIGIQCNYRLPWSERSVRRKFEEIKDWKQHPDLVKFLIMALLAKSDIDFNELEDMGQEEIKAKMRELKTLLEEYANGGFYIIQNKLQNDPFFFEDDYCFISLLQEDLSISI